MMFLIGGQSNIYSKIIIELLFAILPLLASYPMKNKKNTEAQVGDIIFWELIYTNPQITLEGKNIQWAFIYKIDETAIWIYLMNDAYTYLDPYQERTLLISFDSINKTCFIYDPINKNHSSKLQNTRQ